MPSVKRKVESSGDTGGIKKAKIGVQKAKVKGSKPSKSSEQLSRSTKSKKSDWVPQQKIEVISKKNVVPGMLLLGAVLEVNKVHVVFSLPFNLRGILAITDVSDHMTQLVRRQTQAEGTDNDKSSEGLTMEKLFCVGQLLPCYVQAIKGSLANLSINPQLVNAHLTAKDLKPNLLLLGSITSVEDHGYIIDLGISGKTGFLLKKNAAEFVKTNRGGKPLSTGQVLQCAVLSATDAKAVSVGVNPSQVTTAVLSRDLLVRLGSLLPGNLVKATIKQVSPSGLGVSFLDGLEGVVSSQHLSSPSCHSTPDYPVGKKVKGRLLWVNVSAKTAGLTLQERLLGGVAYSFEGVEIGDKFDGAEVLHVDRSSALYLDLGGGIVGYSPSWMVSDQPPPESSKDSVPVKHRREYRVGTLHEARVVQYNSLDGVAIVSLQESVLGKRYMKYSDVRAGEFVEGTVERVCDVGVIVAITGSIHGLCPSIHTSDLQTVVANPGKRYKCGAKVKCRVLNVTPAKRQLLLTCKRSLLRLGKCDNKEEEDEEMEDETGQSGRRDRILCAYSSAKPGDCYTGVVTSVYSYGCVVHFFGKVRGLVHRNDMNSTAASSNPASEYWEGQPVECRVLHCQPELEKLSLSFRLDATGESTTKPVHTVKSGEKTAVSFVGTATGDKGEGPQRSLVAAVSSGEMARLGQESASLSAGPLEKSGRTDPNKVNIGDIITVIVVTIAPCMLKVKYRLWKGRVHCTMARDEEVEEESATVTSDMSADRLKKLRQNVFHHLSPGDTVKARLLKIRPIEIKNQASKKGATISTLELTTKPSLMDPECVLDPEAVLEKKWRDGDHLSAVVSKVTSSGLHLCLSPQKSAFCPLLCVSRDLKVLKNIKKYYAEGQVVNCVMTEVAKKPSRVSMIGSVSSPVEGSVMVGHADNIVAGSHLLVSMPSGCGRLDITETSDHYQPEPFQVVLQGDKLIRCCAVKVEGSKVDLSMRQSRLAKCRGEVAGEVMDPVIHGLEDLSEGGVIRGYVKAITDVGVFVRLGQGIDGRVQITHLRDGFSKDFKNLYNVGQLVKAKVLKVHLASGKVDLSLRLSQVDPEAAKKKSDRKKRKEVKVREEVLGSDGGSDHEELDVSGVEDSSDDVATSEDEDVCVLSESDDDGEQEEHVTRSACSTLPLTGGFRWADEGGAGGRSLGGEDKQQDSSSSEEEEQMEVEASSKKSRRQKKAAKKEEEVLLYKKERSLLNTDKEAESAEDFDRLLASSPNRSSLWVQYMAFYLNTAEVDKARTIAQRALRTIAFNEESEKLNVWVGWLNLENLYGSADSLAQVFENALQKCEPVEVYKKLLTIYESSGKSEQASKLYQTMSRKFGSQQWVWSRYMAFLMQQKRCDQARSVLQRALKLLKNKQDHVTTICKLSTLEYKHGDQERGRTLFESLVSTYPRKVDVWLVYIDAMVTTKDFNAVRELFERATNLKLSAKKMKSIYKKYLSFETQHGSPASAEAVLDKARVFASNSQ